LTDGAGLVSPRMPRPLAAPALHRFRDPDLAVPAVLGLILLAGTLETAILAWEMFEPRYDRTLNLLAAGGLGVTFLAVAIGFRVLSRRGDALAQLSDKLEAAERAKDAAEIANLAKARYLANVSHEIRSPLNAIYGYAQLVEQKADVRPHDAARVIRRCAEHMTSLVESLLDISRLENGLLRVRSEIVHLPDFLEQIVWMMRPAAEAKGLTFAYAPPARLPEFVRTDPSRLRQALINLISNAIKFTDEGSVTLGLAYRGQVATLEIKDTGPGVAPEDQQRIFDPYEQVTGSGGHARPGVGLGLPITKAIIEILGGKLELDSELGRGSCFRVTLMLSEPANALIPDAPQRRIVGHEGPQRSILVVDDDPDQRDFLERFLVACGFEVVALPNGETAVTLCASRRFDLTVLDISLPGLSGWETAARIRETLGQDIIIVMASANAHEFHRPEYSQPTHDHFLVKPYRLDKMAEAIAALLRLSWKWEAIGSAGDAADPGQAGLPQAAMPYVERLRERIQIGHVRGIEAEIALLADAAPGHGGLVNALYAALDEFDLAGMAKLLERT
jgi:signal transduction histidine kinase/CheY-like chemotaxis protein